MTQAINLGQAPELSRIVLINNLPLRTTQSDIFSLVLSGWGPVEELRLGDDGEWAAVTFAEVEAANDFVSWRRREPVTIKSLHICISLAEDTEHRLVTRVVNRIFHWVDAPITVCVRSLSTQTTTDSLRRFFIRFGCDVRGDPVLHRERGGLLYGFVSFVTIADKIRAMTARGRHLHGRRVAVHSFTLQQQH